MFQPTFVSQKEIEDLFISQGLYTEKIRKALQQAMKSHRDQKRDDGNPYLEEHIYPIMKSVAARYKNKQGIEDLLITCALHDVVEDDASVSVSELTNSFGETIVNCVRLLTKSPEENAYGLSQAQKRKINRGVIERLMNAPLIAQIVKLEDRLNNISCFETINSPKTERYTAETYDIYIPFAAKVAPVYVGLLQEQVDRLINNSVS